MVTKTQPQTEEASDAEPTSSVGPALSAQLAANVEAAPGAQGSSSTAAAASDDDLVRLARAYGIATDYWDCNGQLVQVAARTVIAVLAAMGVDAGSSQAVAGALEAFELRSWRRMLPPCLVIESGQSATIEVHVADGDPVEIWLELESAVGNGSAGQGRGRTLRQVENWTPAREVDGRWIGEASFEIPSDLPTGYHRVHGQSAGVTSSTTLIVTPDRLEYPAQLGGQRAWGLAAQLYSVRSRQSWGVGDLADLSDLAVWSAAEHGADYVLINPLHAAEPVPPLEPSPYLPRTRRFSNPIYLRPERIAEFAGLTVAQRAAITELRGRLDTPAMAETIDRNVAWAEKRAALRIVFDAGRTPGRELAFAAFRRRSGPGLERFASWAVLAEQFGSDFQLWPAQLQDPESDQVAEFAAQNSAEIDFVCWLQWVLDEQLAAAQLSCKQAGMALGIMHDLAVGVHPQGSDTWAMQSAYASGVSVGAPPDPYNQLGQDWGQPPWLPDQLAELAYVPYREMVHDILRHAGGIRVDHIIGLFRLWWIPAGLGPTQGTYVRSNHEALVGILALEAQRAGAVVVGEDLGTVEPWVRDYLRNRGIFGTSILWFESDFSGDRLPLPPERWREQCLAAVTTHDLPPTAGYLRGEHLRLRDQLGLLTRPLDEELAADQAEQAAWLHVLRSRGLLAAPAEAADDLTETTDDPAGAADNPARAADCPPESVEAAETVDVEETVKALYRFLALTPARLIAVALGDAVGDYRAQNQPGTVNEYPNWRVPMSGPDGQPMWLEELFTDRRARDLLGELAG